MHLTFYYKENCPHCDTMKQLVAKLELEFQMAVEKIDITGNESAFRAMQNFAPEGCDGAPVVVNTDTKEALCGEVSYRALKKLARGYEGHPQG